MARYILSLRTDEHVFEQVVVELEDHTAVRIELARFVGQLLLEHAEKIWKDEDWRIDVTDEAGLILFVLNVHATNSAATARLRR